MRVTRVVDHDFRFSRLWIIDVGSKKTTELVDDDVAISDPQWSPDGASIAFVVHATPKADDGSFSDIRIVDVATHHSRTLVDNDGPDLAPRWSPDGASIAYLTRDGRNGVVGQLRLAVIDAQGGAPRLVAPGFAWEPGPPAWSRDGRTLRFTSAVRTASQLFAVPAAGGSPVSLSRDDGMLSPVTVSRDGATAAFTFTDREHPPDVYVAAMGGGAWTPRRLTDHNPRVRDLALGRSAVVQWKSRDGRAVEGIVTYPPDYDAARRWPLVVMVHGGPAGVWTWAFPGSWSNAAQVWAGRGWVVLCPNPRGSSGYGEDWLLANLKDWGGGDYGDIQSGIDRLVATGVADSTRLAQMGWSYGGYMTAWAITQTARFKAAMVGAGLTDMVSMYSTTDLQRVLENYFGAQPWNDVAAYQSRSAMTFIKRAKTPTLIQQGAADTRVPTGQSQELYMGLRQNGVPVELVFYPREPHGLREPRHQLDKMRREYAWFAHWVLGEATPDSTTVP